MGNCQAIDAAVLVIQHPNGRLERMYWPVTACEIMRANPGHYVSLIIPIPIQPKGDDQHDKIKKSDDVRAVRFTRVKLLRPDDTLLLGHAYRLVTTQEVMKILRAKKIGKLKKNQTESTPPPEKPKTSLLNEVSACDEAKPRISQSRISSQAIGQDIQRVGITAPLAPAALATVISGRPKTWRPSLYSISEAMY